MGGLRGAVLFIQREKNQVLEIRVQLDDFSGEGDFGIYSNPMIYNGNALDSCSADVVGSQIPNGNLTEKHGPLTFKMSVTNDQLKAYGKDGILGMFNALIIYFHLPLRTQVYWKSANPRV